MDLNNYLELYAEKYVCESIYNNLNQIFRAMRILNAGF